MTEKKREFNLHFLEIYKFLLDIGQMWGNRRKSNKVHWRPPSTPVRKLLSLIADFSQHRTQKGEC